MRTLVDEVRRSPWRCRAPTTELSVVLSDGRTVIVPLTWFLRSLGQATEPTGNSSADALGFIGTLSTKTFRWPVCGSTPVMLRLWLTLWIGPSRRSRIVADEESIGSPGGRTISRQNSQGVVG